MRTCLYFFANNFGCNRKKQQFLQIAYKLPDMRQLKISKSITNRESAALEKYLQEIGHDGLHHLPYLRNSG